MQTANKSSFTLTPNYRSLDFGLETSGFGTSDLALATQPEAGSSKSKVPVLSASRKFKRESLKF